MYVFSFPFITFSLLQRVYRFANSNVLLYILLNLRRTGAMCNLCCALLYILVKKEHMTNSREIQTKTVKITICTLSKQTHKTNMTLTCFFYKVRGKLSRAQKICVLLLMRIFPPPVTLLLFLFLFEVRWFIVLSLQLVV